MLSFFLQCVEYLHSSERADRVEERSDFWRQVALRPFVLCVIPSPQLADV